MNIRDISGLVGRPSPSGRGRRKAAGGGHRSMQILRPSPFLEASPYRARASRPLPEGEGECSAIAIFRRLLRPPTTVQTFKEGLMEHRRIGSLNVSLVGLGCNNFGWR